MGNQRFSLEGQTALVTGAGSGIGQRLSVGLAEAGADVGCLDLSGQRAGLEETTRQVNALGRAASIIEANVTEADSLAAGVALHEQQLGPLDVAINCAGINASSRAEDMPEDQWRRVLDTNLTGVFLSCQAEAATMIPRGQGAIVNIASMSATIANRGLWQAHYNSSKAGVKHLTTTLALEWAGKGIRVNSLSPGYIATAMTSGPEWEEKIARFAQDTPMGRMGSPDDLVGPAIFLATSASNFCTGADLIVDGGFTGW